MTPPSDSVNRPTTQMFARSKGRTMKKLTAVFANVAAFALVLLVAAPAVAQSDTHDAPKEDPIGSEVDPDDQAFRQMIRSIDLLPDREQLEQRWPDAAERLVEMAENEQNTVYERWRATSFLGNFVEPDIREALIGLTEDEHSRIRAKAYYVLGAAFLEEGDDELLDRLVDGLEDESERVPVRIVRSLGWTDHPEAPELLEEIASSSDEDLQPHAQRALERHQEDTAVQ